MKKDKLRDWKKRFYLGTKGMMISESQYKWLVVFISQALADQRDELVGEIKNALIKNEKGILLSNGDDNFVVADSFLEFLDDLKTQEEGE